MNELEKEGLAEVERWKPLTDLLPDGDKDIMCDTFLNPPPLRYTNGQRVHTLKQYEVWDAIREYQSHNKPQEAMSVEQVMAKHITDAQEMLTKAVWKHTPGCTSRLPRSCMCKATQHNLILAEVRRALEI